jgi:dTDP-L-rhamnose 4-epimerase
LLFAALALSKKECSGKDAKLEQSGSEESRLEKRNVLVTGGAGFIGSHLVDALVGAGHRVRVLDALVPQVHGPNASPLYLNPEVEFIEADVCNRDVVARSLEDIDVVFHEAAEVGVGQSMYEIERYVRANDLGTAVLLEAILARRSQIQKLVVASSMSIYGEGAYQCEHCGLVFPQLRSSEQLLDRRWELECATCGRQARATGTTEEKPLFPTSVYAVTKQDQEQFCLAVGRSYKIPTVALRYFNVYGTRQALSNPYTGVCAIFSSRLLNGNRPMIFEDGEQTRDFVHVSDIVQANLLALETDRADYQALNVGTGVATSVRVVCELLAGGLGVDLQPEIVGRYREGDIRHCVSDISKARALLGYEPKVSLENGIPELLSWVRAQAAQDQVEGATAELESRNLVH